MATIPENTRNRPNAVSDTNMSLEDFLLRYSDIEDGYKYEWNKGKIEKTNSMNQEQSFIQKILSFLFYKTKACNEDASFLVETDMQTSENQLRRPDLAIYLGNQQKSIANGENQIAPWIGEVISDTDNINRVNKKLDEYFAAGVKVVWHIFPSSKQVYVYTADDEVTICRGERICSGQPALEGFEISAKDLFAYQEKYSNKESSKEDT